MFDCRFCKFKTRSLRLHLDHHKFHRNITRNFYCSFKKCNKFFKVEGYLTKHVFRVHGISSKEQKIHPVPTAANKQAKYFCTVDICRKELDNYPQLLKHLKSHIEQKEKITCPYRRCQRKYSNLKSFTSHLSKIHRIRCQKIQVIAPESFETDRANFNISEAGPSKEERDEMDVHSNQEPAAVSDSENNNLTDNSESFLQNIAQFYLKLESEFLLPATTIQYIVTELNKLHDESLDVIKDNLRERLLEENLAPEKVEDILKVSFSNDPLKQSQKLLSTNYKRKKFYKIEFDYVAPITVEIDKDKKNTFQYVPIQETIKACFRDKSILTELNKHEIRDEQVLKDFLDGTVYKNNKFFQENPDALKIILYQDAFEVVNPIGAAKKKHKILAIYMVLGNVPEYLRSHVNTIKLVALCKEKDFDHEKVYGKVVEDLQKIEDEGVQFSGEKVKGGLICITGDNLGSHGLGGFVENFSTVEYFCRFCLVTRNEFYSEDGESKAYTTRTPNSYKNDLKEVGTSNNYKGIKFNSVFNQLKYYHVCAPGLPPCIGHDLFEGIVAFDLKLFIDNFVTKKWFTLRQLNKRIDEFNYSEEDKQDKPCLIADQSSKISGGACQIWTFLKVFPLLIEDRIGDVYDEVWRCFILLTEIVEIVCSPTIHKSFLPYLEVTICEYLELRKTLFPDQKLRPKHHYVRHYAELILQFGPLIKVWTMRFESKHRFFKRTIRYMLNFINVTKSLTEKHELFQSYLRLGAGTRFEIETDDVNDFQIDLYSENIQAVIRQANLPGHIEECSKVIIKGTAYKKGCALTIGQDGYQYNIVIAKICMFLLCEDNKVFAVFEIVESEFIPYLRCYKLGRTLRYKCHPLNLVLDFKPLHVYKLGHMQCVKPKYGFVTHSL